MNTIDTDAIVRSLRKTRLLILDGDCRLVHYPGGGYRIEKREAIKRRRTLREQITCWDWRKWRATEVRNEWLDTGVQLQGGTYPQVIAAWVRWKDGTL